MMGTRGTRWYWAALLAALILAVPVTAQASTQTRYSLVHGCYALTGANGQAVKGGENVRMQATTLGRYLLYRSDSTFLTAQDDGSVSPASEPSPAADWRVDPAGGDSFTLTPQSVDGRVLSVGANGAGSLADSASAGGARRVQVTPAGGRG